MTSLPGEEDSVPLTSPVWRSDRVSQIKENFESNFHLDWPEKGEGRTEKERKNAVKNPGIVRLRMYSKILQL